MENQVKWNDVKVPVEPFKKTVVYELTGLKRNPMREDKDVKEAPFMSGVPAKDRIVEVIKGKNGEPDETRVVDIMFIERHEGNVPIPGSIIFYKAQSGAIILNPNKANDIKKYEYLERCNYNESNPNRDPKVNPIFKRVNKAADLAKKRAKTDELVDALIAVRKLTTVELRRLAIGLNITAEDPNEIAGLVSDFAEKDPVRLLTMLENKDLVIMEKAEAAKKAKIIVIDNQARHIKSASGSTLYSWPPEKDADWKTHFVRYVKSEEGQAFYKEMLSQLDAKK